MYKAEGLGVQRLAWAYLKAVIDKGFITAAALASEYLCSSVCLVTKKGMTDVFHVGSYLVGAACLKATLDEGDIAEFLYHLPMGDSIFSDARIGRCYCHTQAIAWVAGDVSLDASFIVLKMSPYEAVIDAMGIVYEELLSEGCLCLWCLCYDKESAGVFVDAMYESYLWAVGIEGGHVTHVPRYGIDEGAREVSGSRMYHHTGWLIDDHEGIVFIDDIEGYVFWIDGAVMLWYVEHEGDDIIRAHLIVALDWFAIDLDVSCIGS